MSFWLSRLEKSDEEFTFRLRNENRENFLVTREVSLEEHKGWLNHTLSRSNIQFWIIYDGSERVGTISATIDEEDISAEIGNVCIDYPFRRKRIATFAISMVEDILKREGIKTIYLVVKANNPIAIEFYKTCGYTAPELPITMCKVF